LADPLPAALNRLYGRIPFGMRLGLDTMQRACARFGHPEAALAVVHVAGTNGKGSVSAMVESIARAHGMKTGLYTSPHLCRFAERIRLGGQPVDDQALASALTRALDADPEVSFFEAATLAALLTFADARVDVAILEVGLGGRLDATNVVPAPRAAAITRIALDHADRLGPTLVDIAREKAGIAKPGLDIVLGPMSAEVRAAIDAVARAGGATTTAVEEMRGLVTASRVGLAGEHQRDNARVAAALGARIGASPAAIEHGIASATWPGRLERIGPFLLDAAHNPDGAEALGRHIRSLGAAPGEVALVFGTLADKDWRAMLDTLAPLAAVRCYVAPESAQPGARGAIDPAEMAARHAGSVAATLDEALARFGHDPHGEAHRRPQAHAAAHAPAPPYARPHDGPRLSRLVVIAGSIVLVGSARALLLGLPRDGAVAL
jgi:dihydrofolate synthase / folylpolyglutamate synthase